MELINQSKTLFKTSKGDFKINSIMEFDESESRTLLRYEGINSLNSLKSEAEEVFFKSKKKIKKNEAEGIIEE